MERLSIIYSLYKIMRIVIFTLAKKVFYRLRKYQDKGILNQVISPALRETVSIKWVINHSYHSARGWVGVVMRGLRKDMQTSEIQSLLTIQPYRILTPRKIQGAYCTIIVMRTLEDGIRTCSQLNRKLILNGLRVRVDLHPATCLRPSTQNKVTPSPVKKIKKETKPEDTRMFVNNLLMLSSALSTSFSKPNGLQGLVKKN